MTPESFDSALASPNVRHMRPSDRRRKGELRLFSPTVLHSEICALLMMVLLALIGCTNPQKPTDGKKHVVTTFTILQDIAQNVAGDRVVVESITKPGAEIHEYEPTPRDIVKAQSADLVLRNGFGLERWFEKFMTRLGQVRSVTLSDGIEPIQIAAGRGDGMPNPHSWMSPKNALVYVENVKKALCDLDPENADYYRANAAAYSARLRAIAERLEREFERIPVEQRWLVTSEGAFSYLARDFGLRELFLWPANADAEATPLQIRKVVDEVRAHRVPVGFSESTISPKPMQEVAKETGIRYGGVLYVDSLTASGGEASTYLEMLDINASRILSGFCLD